MRLRPRRLKAYGFRRAGIRRERHHGPVLLNRAELEAIHRGERDLVFRRWRRPTVRAGGTLRTMLGELAIHEVEVVDAADIDDAQARRAGFADAAALVGWLLAPRRPSVRSRTAAPDPASPIYRIRVSYLGEDPRVALRRQRLSRRELAAMVERILVMDQRATRPWAAEALGLIRRWPQRRAPELAELAGWDTPAWKANVRRLKELGLTESLPVGYRLSIRGEQVAASLRRRAGREPVQPVEGAPARSTTGSGTGEGGDDG